MAPELGTGIFGYFDGSLKQLVALKFPLISLLKVEQYHREIRDVGKKVVLKFHVGGET